MSGPVASEAAPTTFTTWSGAVTCTPARVVRPRDEAGVVAAVDAAAAAGEEVRCVGAGHSFSDIACTSGTHLDLAGMDRVLDVDRPSGLVRVQAGIRLHALAAALHEHGLALENQGDVDVQALAGALQTGTHGTGAAYGNLSSRVEALRLVDGRGHVCDLDAASDPDGLRAARVGLGALGAVTEVTLRAVPGFRLRKVETPMPLDVVLDGLAERVAATDHVELYAFPYTRRALLLESHRTDAPAAPPAAWRSWLLHEVVENRALGAFMGLSRRVPAASPAIGPVMTRVLSASERTDHSHRVFASSRAVRFQEMEYAVPAEHAAEALERVLELIRGRRIPVAFPIEVRFAAADDALLSTAAGRPSAYVAVHQAVGAAWEPYFRAVEAIMDDLDGRPHWGKRHFQRAATLRPRYPGWDAFAAVRARLDPDGRFAGEHLRRVLGPVA